MSTLVFDHTPDLEKLGGAFPDSPYFSLEALEHKAGSEKNNSGIIVASVGEAIVGALAWENDRRLKIGQVEVSTNQRKKGIGSQLILEAERINVGRVHQTLGYLNDRRNDSSANMFARAGYTRKDDLKFYKTL